MTALAKDKTFIALLKSPNKNADDVDYITPSYHLWSYITEVNATGSDSTGWTYNYNAGAKMDDFLHVDDIKKAIIDETGASHDLMNNWDKYNTTKISTKGTEKTYNITVGEFIDLRYLDLLMTLNAISNNRDYWSSGINSYMTKNAGAANISITSGVVARMDSYSTKGGDVECGL